eukprot:CAMPEP_0117426538 /NCGR_PEP_ID=MMETSP0758-20121206/6619_1 /TAXON_ID=63605 /ORGANISM="Percolomonas cosmopolitus, Strain AE-1 (ATCC 50343)" /LENGTH=441 /DNA_ID=CAMNT_0005211741 /DNA_START=870 /DNA_END=2191 /DNA_ORIENTATION=+
MVIGEFVESGEAENQMMLCMRLLTLLLPKIPSSMLKQCDLLPVYTWYWEDDYHNFSAFQKNESEALENALQIGKEEVEIMRGRYRVNVKTFKQVNSSTKIMRNVKRSNFPTSFKRCDKYYHEEGMFQSFEMSEEAAGKSSDVYSLDLKKDLVKYLFDERIIPLFIKLWDKFDHNYQVQEDLAQCTARMFKCSTRDHVAPRYQSLAFKKLISKFIVHPNVIVQSHGLYILNELVERQLKNVIQYFVHENIVDTLKNVSSSSSKLIANSAIYLYKTHFKQAKQHRTKEEDQLFDCVESMKKQTFQMEQLDFLDEEHISMNQFMKSNFVHHFLKYLKSNEENLSAFAKFAAAHPKLFESLIRLTNDCIDKLETFQRINDVENPLDSKFCNLESVKSLSTSITVTLEPTCKSDMERIDLTKLRARQQKDYDASMQTYQNQVAQEL